MRQPFSHARGPLRVVPSIRVEAEDDLGQVGHESIEIATGVHLSSKRVADGSDADAVDAWRSAACWAPS